MALNSSHVFPSPLVGEGARRADEGLLSNGTFSNEEKNTLLEKITSGGYPSSGASRHLLPQGEKEKRYMNFASIPAYRPTSFKSDIPHYSANAPD